MNKNSDDSLQGGPASTQIVKDENDGQDVDSLLEELVGGDLSDNKQKVVARLKRTIAHYQGPIPHPQILKEYDNVHPGLARQIVESWKNQGEHRLKLEEHFFTNRERRSNRSQFFALLLSIFGILTAAFLASTGGNTYVAVTIVILAIGGPHAALSLVRHFERKQDDKQDADSGNP